MDTPARGARLLHVRYRYMYIYKVCGMSYINKVRMNAGQQQWVRTERAASNVRYTITFYRYMYIYK